MNRSAYSFTSTARRSTLPERLFAGVLTLAFMLIALLFGMLLLAAVAAVVLVFSVRLWWWQRRGTPSGPANGSISLAQCDCAVISKAAGSGASSKEQAL